MFTRKPRLRPAEFLITSAKRLLQHNLPLADFRHAAGFSMITNLAPFPADGLISSAHPLEANRRRQSSASSACLAKAWENGKNLLNDFTLGVCPWLTRC